MQNLIQEAHAARALRREADRFSSAAWLADAQVKQSSRQVAGMLSLADRANAAFKQANDADRAVNQALVGMNYVSRMLATHTDAELADMGFDVPALKWERDHPGTCYSEMPAKFEGAL